jgi:hypothetical protein
MEPNDNEGALEVTFEAGNFEMRDPVAEKEGRINYYEKNTGKKYL